MFYPSVCRINDCVIHPHIIFCTHTYTYPSEVIVGFPLELYTVGEEEYFVMVCAVLTGQTENNVLAMLSTISRNAAGYNVLCIQYRNL